MHIHSLSKSIREASDNIGKSWPLYAFVTSNPLSGYENLPFREALRRAGQILGARVYPGANLYREAWEKGEIQPDILLPLLREQGMKERPEYYLEQLESLPEPPMDEANCDLDRITSKWVAAFLDEGLAEWAMPGKHSGFYNAWRKLAVYDRELRGLKKYGLPATASVAIREVLSAYPEEVHTRILTCQLAALPGWVGYIRYREEAGTAWQTEYPISLEDFLAVRLMIARCLQAPILPPPPGEPSGDSLDTLRYIWLNAWERSWQKQLIRALSEPFDREGSEAADATSADAQMVFCIDTRSEPIRRHIEQQGNYETFGYAGFFGIAMDYEDPRDGLVRKSCPPILNSAYRVREIPGPEKEGDFAGYLKKHEANRFIRYFLRRMKNMLPSTFGYVEGTGVYYGALILARTWLPGFLYRLIKKYTPAHESICEPEISQPGASHTHKETSGIPLGDRVAIVKSAFDLLGWDEFAPLVIFAGHGSHSTNNPFASSLDCGACAASPGRHNARMLAKLANQRDVRRTLMIEHGLIIPETTYFLGAEHNTTTDEIHLFDSEVPGTHRGLLKRVRQDLDRARECAVRERPGMEQQDVSEALRRAGDWAETRPEWGLARNAGFVIGPRRLTRNRDLGGRCFLHSYRWEQDPEGSALEAILQGPMVVTQWINNHYYFATVDPERFGGGDKITQNITGQFGVVRGNGGDLKSGLPLQSLYGSDLQAYHQPLRLSVCIEAPKNRVENILSRNENLKTLLDNHWIHLLVLDPLDGNTFRYIRELNWEPEEETGRMARSGQRREAAYIGAEMV